MGQGRVQVKESSYGTRSDFCFTSLLVLGHGLLRRLRCFGLWVIPDVYQFHENSSQEDESRGESNIFITNTFWYADMDVTNFATFSSFFVWTVILFTGIGLEFFVWREVCRIGWSTTLETLHMIARFLFPVLGVCSLGLALHGLFVRYCRPSLDVALWDARHPRVLPCSFI